MEGWGSDIRIAQISVIGMANVLLSQEYNLKIVYHRNVFICVLFVSQLTYDCIRIFCQHFISIDFLRDIYT